MDCLVLSKIAKRVGVPGIASDGAVREVVEHGRYDLV
jgi:regulator of RNase E activity RraA